MHLNTGYSDVKFPWQQTFSSNNDLLPNTYCVQGALLCAGSTPGPKANTGSIQFSPLPFIAARCVLLQRINQVIKLFGGT